MVMANGLDFDAALEAVAGATLFTTHTPVPAGHDIFPRDLLAHNLGPYLEQSGWNLTGCFPSGQSTVATPLT